MALLTTSQLVYLYYIILLLFILSQFELYKLCHFLICERTYKKSVTIISVCDIGIPVINYTIIWVVADLSFKTGSLQVLEMLLFEN